LLSPFGRGPSFFVFPRTGNALDPLTRQTAPSFPICFLLLNLFPFPATPLKPGLSFLVDPLGLTRSTYFWCWPNSCVFFDVFFFSSPCANVATAPFFPFFLRPSVTRDSARTVSRSPFETPPHLFVYVTPFLFFSYSFRRRTLLSSECGLFTSPLPFFLFLRLFGFPHQKQKKKPGLGCFDLFPCCALLADLLIFLSSVFVYF